MLIDIEVYTIADARPDHAPSVEEVTPFLRRDLLERFRESDALLLGPEKLGGDGSLGRPDRRRCHDQDLRSGHSRLDRSPTDGPHDRGHPERRELGVIRVHGLEVVGPEHDDDHRQRRVDLDPLFETNQPVPAGLERIIPGRPTPVETVFDHADPNAGRPKGEFHDARPPVLERQPPPRIRDDAPGEGVTVDQNL